VAAPNWRRFDDSLGKYYGCHYAVIAASLRKSGKRPVFSFQKSKDGVYTRRKLQFSAEFQRRHTLFNSTFRLHFPPYADARHGSGALSTIYLAKSILASEHGILLDQGAEVPAMHARRRMHLQNIASDFPSVLKFGWDFVIKRHLAIRKLPYTLIANRDGSYPLEFNSEQVPQQQNCIGLVNERDADGMLRAAIHWKLTEADINSGLASFQWLKEKFDLTQDCRVAFDATALRDSIASAHPIGGHHLGATRMSLSDKTGVVDRNCQVHGVANLFVSSGSVFPTYGHANPTLTIVALALRLAEFLKTSRS
jgi:hypothetical protein